MSRPEDSARVAFTARIALLSYRHPIFAIAFTVVASVALGLGARHLRINPDISELLPHHYESVSNLDRLRDRVGGIGSLNLVVSGGDESTLRDFADAIAPKLEALDSVLYVNHRRPIEFFEDRALYYLEVEDLAEIQRRFAARELYERLHANPLYIDLEETGPPSLDMSDILEKYESNDGPGRDPHFWDEKNQRLIIFIKPNQLASNMTFAKQLNDAVRGVLAHEEAAKGLRIELSGRYQKVVDLQAVIQRDLRWASLVAVVLMLAFLFVHLRQVGMVVCVCVPLVIGLLWTYGLAGWALDSLNILTTFLGAILLGVGIDVGIHIVDRARETDSPEERILVAFGESGKAAAIATLTTVFGFGSLLLSDFRVFREFGLLSSAGLLFILISYLVLLPTLLRFVVPKTRTAHATTARFSGRLRRQAAWGFWLPTLALVGCAIMAKSAAFNYDFSALDPQGLRSFVLDREVSDYLGTAQTPLVIMSESDAEAEAAAAALRKGMSDGTTSIDRVAIRSEIVASEQDAKRELMDELAKTLELIVPEDLEPDEREDLESLVKKVEAPPFEYSDLPIEVKRPFVGLDGKGAFALVFPGVPLTDGALIRELANELRGIPLETREISATGEPMVLADVLDSVFSEAPRSVAIAGGVILVLLCVFLGSILMGVLCLTLALLTLVATIGLMPVVGLEFNYLNVIILPVILGVSVDGAAHLLSRLRNDGLGGQGLDLTGESVTGALTTTAMGFVALSLVSHPGLASLGNVALLGLGVNLVLTLLWLPGAMFLWSRAGDFAATRGVGPLHLTVLRAGRAGTGPGTLGAVFALPIAYAVSGLPLWLWVVVLTAWTLLAIWQAERYCRREASKDPQEIVLDETLGCLVTLAFVPTGWAWAIAGFVAFRAFDILKPFPVGWIDRKLAGGAGVILDDIAAGLMAGALLHLAHLYL